MGEVFERPKVFQIGMNRCGTRSLWDFFQRNGYTALHNGKGTLARGIVANLRSGQNPLQGVEDVDLYADMEALTAAGLVSAFKEFRALDVALPGSKFILNTRAVDDWINSRMNLMQGKYAQYSLKASKHRSLDSLKAAWKEEWHQHHADVLSYFQGRPGQLFVWDIDKTPTADLADWLAPEYQLDPSLMPHHHRDGSLSLSRT